MAVQIQLRRATAAEWTTANPTLAEGELAVETDTKYFKIGDGITAWNSLNYGGLQGADGVDGSGLSIATTQPTSPANGDLWWSNEDGNLYVYYDDGTSQQWVAVNSPSVHVGTTAPAGYQGQLWFDSTEGKTYIYYDDGTTGQWVSAIGGSLAGSVVQVVSTTKTDTFSTTSTSYVDVTGLSASITPRSTSSKILVLCSIVHGANDVNAGTRFGLARNGTLIAQPVGGTSQDTMNVYTADAVVRDSSSINYLDSPNTTSSVTYNIKMFTSSATSYVNRGSQDFRSISTITLMEIAG